MPNQIIFILTLCVYIYTHFFWKLMLLEGYWCRGDVCSEYFFWKETDKTVAEFFWTTCSLFYVICVELGSF